MLFRNKIKFKYKNQQSGLGRLKQTGNVYIKLYQTLMKRTVYYEFAGHMQALMNLAKL